MPCVSKPSIISPFRQVILDRPHDSLTRGIPRLPSRGMDLGQIVTETGHVTLPPDISPRKAILDILQSHSRAHPIRNLPNGGRRIDPNIIDVHGLAIQLLHRKKNSLNEVGDVHIGLLLSPVPQDLQICKQP